MKGRTSMALTVVWDMGVGGLEYLLGESLRKLGASGEGWLAMLLLWG